MKFTTFMFLFFTFPFWAPVVVFGYGIFVILFLICAAVYQSWKWFRRRRLTHEDARTRNIAFGIRSLAGRLSRPPATDARRSLWRGC